MHSAARRDKMLERISDGRTDLVFDYLEAGHAANSKDANGVSLIKWCAYYSDFFIHPDAVPRSTRDHGMGWGNGMEVNLLGKPHVSHTRRNYGRQSKTCP